MSTFRDWMYKRKDGRGSLCPQFERGVEMFMTFAYGPRGSSREGLIKCPCVKCKCRGLLDYQTVHMHLIRVGFMPSYYVWSQHGETDTDYGYEYEGIGESSNDGGGFGGDGVAGGGYGNGATVGGGDENAYNPRVDMVQDLFPDVNIDGQRNGEEPHPRAKLFYQMFTKAQQPLYPGSDITLLDWASTVMSNKTANRDSQVSADATVKLSMRIVPPEYRSQVPQDWRSVKNLMMSLGLSVRTYDFCINHCYLFYTDGPQVTLCPVCGAKRYEDKKQGSGKDVARRKLWYFPLTERLQRLYMSRYTAEKMIWHSKCKPRSDPVIHPAGSRQWAEFDEKYPDFAKEIRNVRLALCTDGFDPNHGTHTDGHSIWPVFVTPYNLPPELAMRPEFIFLTLLISGPEDPTHNIDVMLRPVVDEFKDLWSNGALTYDSFKKENFIMKAALMCTINDLPAYGMLSGWSTAGKLACPYCMQNTDSIYLKDSHKTCWFDCHRKFLPEGHRERRNKKDYRKGRVVTERVPERYPIEGILRQIDWLPDVTFGKVKYHRPPGYGESHNWTKRSIFWELVYWPSLLVRHNVDVMHTEKGCYENVIWTTFDEGKKSKDRYEARLDLAVWTNRTSLFIDPDDDTTKPRASYTLLTSEVKAVCDWIQTLQFPDGYCSNLGSKVKSGPWRLANMKTHDCHVFMQRLLPIALKDMIPDKIWEVLCELSNFFRAICASEISPPAMLQLADSIVLTLCKLEKIFPPDFFSSLEHMIVHLPYEAMMLGPVFYRWMYPFERMMWLLKNHQMNKNHIEGSIVQAYLMREVANFTTLYFGGTVHAAKSRVRRNSIPRFDPLFDGQLSICEPIGIAQGKAVDKMLSEADAKAAILYIVINCFEFQPFVRMFDDQYEHTMTSREYEVFRHDNLVDWLRAGHHNHFFFLEPRLHVLLFGGVPRVRTFQKFMCNGLRWHTLDYGSQRKTMCSGVSVMASGVTYHGLLKEIVEISFITYGLPLQKIVLFKCDWFDHATVHPRLGLVEINSRRRLGTKEVFILASQAQQVYYAPYAASFLQKNPKRKGLWVVCPARARHIIDTSSVTEIQEADDEFYEDPTPPLVTNPVDNLASFIVIDELAEDETVEMPNEPTDQQVSEEEDSPEEDDDEMM